MALSLSKEAGKGDRRRATQDDSAYRNNYDAIFGKKDKPAAESSESNVCKTCGNTYLTTRIDIYKDKREFIYCDVCGALADLKTWNFARSK